MLLINQLISSENSSLATTSRRSWSTYRKLTTRFGVANGCFSGECATLTLESAANGCSNFPTELIFGAGAITFPILSTLAGTVERRRKENPAAFSSYNIFVDSTTIY
jgi:hypothetical protein